MNDMNQCLFIGRLVREPLIHQGKNGTCALFTIATNRRWNDKSGQPQTESAFIACKAFNGWTTALAGRPKGTPLLLSGRLRTESWEQDDTTRSQLTLICESVQVLTFSPRETPTKPEVATTSSGVPF